MSSLPEHREQDVKTRILLTAKSCFAEQGYDGTSVRQICQLAGVNVSMVSYHFGGKEKVYEAIFECFHHVNQLRDVDYAAISPVEGLVLLLRSIIESTMRDKEMSDIIQQEMTMHSERQEYILKYLLPIWKRVKQVLERGREQGVFNYRSLNQALLLVLHASISQKRRGQLESILEPENFSQDEIVDQTIAFILQGLGVKPA
ncbi:TetR/AcrR family transcriptional regulator [Paenibacillus sp. FSL K6-1230]|uniref:TetR/AcrR family transcriptional regulator n=1 Tax=Paenibacillus sp. FSL K6-1230 TaxID=2921603 RepID=UPI0030F51E62